MTTVTSESSPIPPTIEASAGLTLPTAALLTDHYELTMLDAALRDGRGERWCVFETFARRLPRGRRYGVVAGVARVVDAIRRFTFDDAALSFLSDHGIVSDPTLEHLAGYRFEGTIDAYREGELFFPGSPVLTVEGRFIDAVVLETVILSIMNHDSAIASAASRMVTAAGDRPLMEFGSRRTHELAAVASARAAYLVGFGGTSNLEAGRRHGIPTMGTSAHAFTLLHDDEREAFRGQIEADGVGTTLLVDTYDTEEGIRRAIEAGGPDLGAIRIDSGDLADASRSARRQLDEAGLTDTRIVVSGDLEEHRIAELAGAPIDAYGVGTELVTGSGAPTAGFVYKLVARADDDGRMTPVAKDSGAKSTVGGRKTAFRSLDDGIAVAEHVTPDPAFDAMTGRRLQVPVIADGELLHAPSLDDIRDHHAAALAELPPAGRELSHGDPAIPTIR